jgi:hypothetical protein
MMTVGGAEPPAQPPGGTPPSAAPSAVPVVPNNSGTGGPAPAEIRGWNWGALFLSFVWGIANGVWLSMVVFVLWGVWNVVLAIKGNEWAWQNRRFESVEQFRDTQRAWSKWGWIIFVVGLAVLIVTILLAGGLVAIIKVMRGQGHVPGL